MSIHKSKIIKIGIFIGFISVMFQPAVLFSADSRTGRNLLFNGGFEEVKNNLPFYWVPNGWLADGNTTKYSIGSDQPHSGKYFAVIENIGLNDSRFIQQVDVKPNTVYRLSCWIKTENVDQRTTGASITVLLLNYLDHSPELRNSSSEWKYVEFYIRTTPDQYQVYVAARLGEFGSTNTGTACFDDFEFREVFDVPEGTYISSLSSANTQKQDTSNATAAGARKVSPLPFSTTLMFAAFFVLLAAAVYFLFIRREGLVKVNDKVLFGLFAFLLIIGFALRIYIGMTHEGYHNDVQSFKAWTIRLSTVPYNEFYVNNLFADYPPGYMYVLSFLGQIAKILGISVFSPMFILLIKLPSIISDTTSAFLVFMIVKTRLNIKSALGMSILYLFNPGIIFTSAFWGQVDSIAALLVLLMIYCILKNRLGISALLLGFSILVKIQTGFMVFILMYALIVKKDLKTWLVCTAAGFLSFTATVLPFIPRDENIFWIFNLVTKTVTQYPYASVNAFNLMGLFGGNWVPVANPFLFINYSMWGYIFGALIMVFITALYFKMKDEARNYFVPFVFITFVFLLMPTMHERYLYPAILLGLMSFVYLKPGLFFLFAGYSVTYYINIAYVMEFFLTNRYIFQGDVVLIITSICNLIMMAYPIKLAVEFCFKKSSALGGIKIESQKEQLADS